MTLTLGRSPGILISRVYEPCRVSTAGREYSPKSPKNRWKIRESSSAILSLASPDHPGTRYEMIPIDPVVIICSGSGCPYFS